MKTKRLFLIDTAQGDVFMNRGVVRHCLALFLWVSGSNSRYSKRYDVIDI